MKTNKKLIGDFFLGLENVQVFVDPVSRDGFAQLPGNWFHEGKVRVGFLTIGLRAGYDAAVGNLIHEAAEYLSVRLQLRYHADLRAHQGPSVGILLMTHDQFSELTDALGEFIANCLPIFNKAYQKYKIK
jgi:hypothetical protein